jgi:hypothetical protein
MKTFLAVTFFLTSLIACTHLFILLSSNLPWTMFNHLHAIGVMAIAMFSTLGMYALTELPKRNRRWNHE